MSQIEFSALRYSLAALRSHTNFPRSNKRIMIKPKDKKKTYGEIIYVYKNESFSINLIRLETSKSIFEIPWIKMEKTRSAFGYKKELGGGERIILCLSYSWVVQAHSNHNIVFKL